MMATASGSGGNHGASNKKKNTSSSNSSKRSKSIQLGFSVELEDQEHRMFVGHHSPVWRDWDGGKLGGCPSWLQPRDIPKSFLKCRTCSEPLCFIGQLYAPADDVTPEAFHRTFYVFGCPSKQCAAVPAGSVRVLRAQLPQENPFYPKEDHQNDGGDDEEHENVEEQSSWSQHVPDSWNVNLCRVCGQRGTGKCPIQGYYFCGKHHQKEHKEYVFDRQQLSKKAIEFTFLPSVYTESELVVEEEPPMLDQDHHKNQKTKGSKMAGKYDDFDAVSDDSDDDEKDEDEDVALEQKDLDEMTGATSSKSARDATTLGFFARVNGPPNVQEQCLRYLRWPNPEHGVESQTPLWIRSDYQPNVAEAEAKAEAGGTTIPNCQYCGAARKFEFQLMPQMLSYLLKDHQVQRARDALQDSINFGSSSGSSNSKNDCAAARSSVKEAIEKAASIIEQAPPEQIPPAFVQAKEQAVAKLRYQLLEPDYTRKEWDWGVIAVYTCTGSCGSGIHPAPCSDVEELGAYREEFAWKQPSLDVNFSCEA
jgi:pre-rRNA-processing protein TSR4